MNLFEKYLKSLESGDPEKMASLFTEDALFYDEGPVKMGGEPIHLKGRGKIMALYQQAFSFNGGPLFATNVVINGNAMRYDIRIGEILYLALSQMKEENGLIAEYRVNVI
jgi:hypothetical protein